MSIKYTILIFIAMAAMFGAQGAESDGSTASDLQVSDLQDNQSGNQSDQAQLEEIAGGIITETEAPFLNLKSIWRAFLGEDGITIALDQDSTNLFGRAAKYDGQAWNGLVLGMVQGDNVWLAVTALKGDSLEAIMMNGTYASEQISGTFTQYDMSGTKIASGIFTASAFESDIQSFQPAKVAEVPAPTPATTEPQVQAGSTEGTAQSADTGASRFVDVRKYKDQIGPAGLLAPGMGGSGLS